MNISRTALAAFSRVLPDPLRVRLTVSSPRYLAKRSAGTPAAVMTLACKVLSGDTSPARLWSISPDAALKVAAEIGLKTHKIWNEKAVDAELREMAQTSRDGYLLAALALNHSQVWGRTPISLLAAGNKNTQTPDVIAALVRLPAEECDELLLADYLFHRADIKDHGGKYGSNTAIAVEAVLREHAGEEVWIMHALRTENPKLAECLDRHRGQV